jgi:transposase IS66 family protein
MLNDLDLTTIPDEGTRRAIRELLNLVETLATENRALRDEVQGLRDEINRLKGEQGHPTVRPQTKPDPAEDTDHSSERERHMPKPRTRGRKVAQIIIHQTRVLTVDPAGLPADAEFKDYVPSLVQDVRLQTENTRFLKEKFYSASEQQTYLADLPLGYVGAFGPGLRALVVVLAHACQMTEPKIRAFLQHLGVVIADGTISNLLIKDQESFHAEKDAAYRAGLLSGPWQHIDDTATRVSGQNHHCHVVTNPLHTTYITTEAKDRLTVIDVLRGGQPRIFRLNGQAITYLEHAGVSAVTRQKLSYLPHNQDLDEATLQQLLDTHLPGLGAQQRKWIVDATAVAAYHAQTEWPVVRLLICDGAGQFSWVTEELALCWVHEGRHYKKLVPYLAVHRTLLCDFLKQFWAFYDELLAYRQDPTPKERVRLTNEFDTLFATVTGYRALDERIALTRAKKASLLLVLTYPEIPLHNNAAELGARQRVRKRDISFGPRSPEGTKAWDTFMSLVATTRKLGVDFYEYVHDRISGTNQIPPLADLIAERATELNLGASWATS